MRAELDAVIYVTLGRAVKLCCDREAGEGESCEVGTLGFFLKTFDISRHARTKQIKIWSLSSHRARLSIKKNLSSLLQKYYGWKRNSIVEGREKKGATSVSMYPALIGRTIF